MAQDHPRHLARLRAGGECAISRARPVLPALRELPWVPVGALRVKNLSYSSPTRQAHGFRLFPVAQQERPLRRDGWQTWSAVPIGLATHAPDQQEAPPDASRAAVSAVLAQVSPARQTGDEA